jgi:RNA polymerase sigma-70 factor (ECF subfamily)
VLPETQGPPARRPPDGGPALDVAWLEPYPDSALEGIADTAPSPHARYEMREAVQLAFVAAIQHLPPRQRAALLLHDVLGWSAPDSARLLDASVASINSALQRARAAVQERTPELSQQATLRQLGDDGLRQVVDSYVDAWQRSDIDAVVAMLTEDACFAMPPLATWFHGHDGIRTFLAGWPLSGLWRWKPIVTTANGQPALAYYSWDDDAQGYIPFALNVLTLRGDKIAEIDAFITRSTEDADREVLARLPEQEFQATRLAAAFENFGLPDRLD